MRSIQFIARAVAEVTPAQRLSAVGYVILSFLITEMVLTKPVFYSMSLIGVLGATGACKYSRSYSFLHVYIREMLMLRIDTTLRAIGTRSHPMHSLVSFCIQCVIASTTL